MEPPHLASHNQSSSSFFPFDLNELPPDDVMESAVAEEVTPLEVDAAIAAREATAIATREVIRLEDAAAAAREAAATREATTAPSTVQIGHSLSPAQCKNQERVRLTDDEVRKLIEAATLKFNTYKKTVYNLWTKAKAQMQAGKPIDVQARLRGCVGRKKVSCNLEQLIEVPFQKRQNLRAVAYQLKESKTTGHRLFKAKKLRTHSNAIKPLLNEVGKIKRLKFCLAHLNPLTIPINPTFHDFYDHIHIDEKWFELSKEIATFYTLPNEADPYRATQSKKFSPKIMFLAVVGRPRFGDNGETLCDGKVGIFPFTFKEAAKRKSKNRPAGTLETKPIPIINRDVMKQMLLSKVISAIKSKWSDAHNKRVIVQQDNAKPHVNPTDLDIIHKCQEDGWDIELKFQPPNSPDLNVLDLGFFRAIDTIKDQKAPRNISELITAVETAFTELTPQALNKVFLTLQCVMEEIIKQKGDNRYKIPHIGKEKLERAGQ